MKRIALIALALACGKSHAPAAGSTGAFGIVTVDGKQKMYLPLIDTSANPLGLARIAVVDVGIAGNGTAGAPAQIGIIPLGAGSVRLTGGDETIVIASGGSKVWFIDPRSGAVVNSLTVTAPTSSFSGGGGYVTGIAVDSGNRRAVLAVGNGFAIVDLDKNVIARTIVAAPSENFGYDSVAQRIVAPFYACPTALTICGQYKTPSGATISDGLNVIDLRDDSVYTYQDATAANPAQPLGGEPDSAAADPGTGLAVIPSELNGGSTVLDLAHASFDKTKESFTAPHKTIATVTALTGVAIEPGRHFAFWAAEGGSLVAVADLGKDNSLVTGEVPSAPGFSASAWRNMGDPHGLAVTTGIAGGKPVGFVVNADQRWIARIDLESMLATHSPNPLGPAEMAPFITFLDANP
jgi:hypothetical protein